MSNSQVTFKNAGLIDPRCITTIGVSVKETENPIGFFGTGLKYAIAIILRAGGCITINRGMEMFEFDTTEVTIRERPVQVVRMNGQELGFTTDLGKHWKMWQAFREIYCNTIDEGGTVEFGMGVPEHDHTMIVVTLPEFAECFANLGQFILQTKPIHQAPGIDFHAGPSASVFYRSIRVADGIVPKPFLFTPNLTEKVDLTEDRTLKENWSAMHRLARVVLESKDRDFLRRWLSAGRDFAEHIVDLDWPSIQPSDEFLDVADQLCMDPSRPVNVTVMRVLARTRKPPAPVSADLFPTEKIALDKAVRFCRALKYPVDEFPIVVVESLGESIMGRADVEERRILIARHAIQVGTKYCAATLIEEWAHIKHGFEDCGRPMQNWLFDQLTRLGEAYLYEANTNQRHQQEEPEYDV